MRFSVPLIACALTLAACADDSIPEGDPGAKVNNDRFGENVASNIALGAKNQKFWVKALMTGYAEPAIGDMPAKMETLPRTGNCQFPKPQPGARVALLTVTDAPIHTTIYSIDPADIRKRAELYVQIWAKQGKEPDAARAETDHDIFKIANVVVTDTSAPVHLVLSGRDKVLWNIQTAEGVKLSAVNVIDETNHAAVANLPAGVPALAMTGSFATNCKAVAYRAPAASWGVMDKRWNDEPTKMARASRTSIHLAFNAWFRSNFGEESESVAIGAERVTNFLVGPAPAPEARLAYRPLRGSEVKVTPGGTLVFAEVKVSYRNKNDELVRAEVQKISGGSVARLNK